jgi:hypothetical protein
MLSGGIRTRVESACGVRLETKIAKPVSDLAFNFNLRRYAESDAAAAARLAPEAVHDARVRAVAAWACSRAIFGSTQTHFVGYAGCRISPQSIRQGDTGRCDQNGLG